ncbi:MAG: lysophospholipid acyltransferase family protein [Allosphingosinicella sp.]|uniref:lysophospholipid acyltransferase family protein n=1 Tax=Allosphingosinicella sp. TaxID=2823234 RepID=UPI0039291C35
MFRLPLRILAMVLGLLVCLPLHYGWKAAGRASPWPRRFLWWTGFAAGLRVRVEGRPLRSHVLFLANHVSWLDILIVAGATGAAFISKAEVRRWPLVGWLAGLNDTIYVDRAARGGVRGQADALRDALAAGRAVALFPEGTTEGGHVTLPFRPSLLASLFPALDRVQVQPAAIDFGAAVHDIAWVGDEGALANAGRILSRKGTIPVTIRFLAPVDPHIFGDRKALARQAQAEIEEALGGAAPQPR